RSPSRSRPKPRCRRRAARRARVRPSPLLYAAPATSTTAASSRVAWRRSPETLWQEALGRLLVVAEAEVHRLAKLRVGGPLGERDLRDEARLEPRDVAHARRVGEGRRRARERPEALREARQRALVEPRADLADEAQLRAGVRAEEERAEMRPGAAGGGVAADHELLLLLDLDLEPAPRAARLVRRCLLLRDQALEALLLRRAIGGEPVRRQAARREDLVRTRDRGVERGAARRSRPSTHRQSNAAKTTGTSPFWRSWKRETSSRSKATASPSRRIERTGSARTAAEMSGKRALHGFPVRETRLTSRPSLYARTR